MREEFSKVCFETLLQFSFSNKVSTPQEGYISRMALSVLLKRSQDVLRRYVEDERLSGRCPLPRYQATMGIYLCVLFFLARVVLHIFQEAINSDDCNATL